jgi:exopolysaccharide production protein ExoQ
MARISTTLLYRQIRAGTPDSMFRSFENCFTVLILFYCTGAVWVMATGKDAQSNPQASNLFALILEISILSGVACFSFFSIRQWMENALFVKPIWVLMFYVVMSSLWSAVPLFSLRRALVLTATTAVGVFFGTRYSVYEQTKLLAIAFGLVAVCSCAMVILPPHLGLEGAGGGSHYGAWRGAFVQKNYLGRVMTLGALSFYVAPFKTAFLRISGIAICSLLVLLSQSKSGIVFLLILICALPLISLLKLRTQQLIPAVIVCGAITLGIGSWAASNATQLLALIGRDSTLSGRTSLWSVLWEKYSQHSTFGYGFAGFWPVEYISVWVRVRWTPLHAHNGYLDLLLDGGLVGAVLLVAAFIPAMVNGTRFLRQERTKTAAWPMLFITFVLIYNCTEVALLNQLSIIWVLFTGLSVGLCRYRFESALQRMLNQILCWPMQTQDKFLGPHVAKRPSMNGC